MPKTRVLLLCGGKSAEHEVSVISARSIYSAIDRDKYETIPVGITRAGEWVVSEPSSAILERKEITSEGAIPVQWLSGKNTLVHDDGASLHSGAFDVVFPVLHGPQGEDGCMQGLLELRGVPYVGAGVAASAVGMDKDLARSVFASKGLRQTRYLTLKKHRWLASRDEVLSEVEQSLAYPLFVKPANLGSSIGISKASTRAALIDAIDKAARYDLKILVEESVEQARELECAVIGNDSARASVIGEIVPGAEFYDYTTKYLDDRSQLIVPAELPKDKEREIQDMSLAAFHAIDGAGPSRVDFLMSPDGEIFLNEINTMPGFTPISMYPRLWGASGLDYADLIDQLIGLGLERHAERALHALR